MPHGTIVHLEITKPVWRLSLPLRELLNRRMCRCIVNRTEWQFFVPDEDICPCNWSSLALMMNLRIPPCILPPRRSPSVEAIPKIRISLFPFNYWIMLIRNILTFLFGKIIILFRKNFISMKYCFNEFVNLSNLSMWYIQVIISSFLENTNLYFGRVKTALVPQSAGPVPALLPDVSFRRRRLSHAFFCFIRVFYIRIYRSACADTHEHARALAHARSRVHKWSSYLAPSSPLYISHSANSSANDFCVIIANST